MITVAIVVVMGIINVSNGDCFYYGSCCECIPMVTVVIVEQDGHYDRGGCCDRSARRLL